MILQWRVSHTDPDIGEQERTDTSKKELVVKFDDPSSRKMTRVYVRNEHEEKEIICKYITAKQHRNTMKI
jgi:hypothetical protein